MAKTVYIAGKITGLPEAEYKTRFKMAAIDLRFKGHQVLSPIEIVPEWLSYDHQMNICLALVDAADAVYFLENWKDSNGAKEEHARAVAKGKALWYQDSKTRGDKPNANKANKR